ncbi:MAG: biotin--[acetyl-CoA-carboxylase] ligase [Planctomycetes bacterium]|nr:biotin--[acetyl-CoA-carboxylase] ligase [Planctomycetota bacterium]MBL7007755.1 biotin--[acetyl-CoA-carboxylase] ligase [Planctomycetota bacterium]
MRPLRAERIAGALSAARRLATRVEVLEECASTSDLLRQRIAETGTEANHGLLLIAERQTGGRGRAARDWWSGPPGRNLAFSLCVQPPVEPYEAAGLLAACALATAVEACCGREAALKWPNDVLVDGAKVAGLLAEVPSTAPPAVLVGIGLNVLTAPPPGTAPYPTACLARFSPAEPDRERVLVDLLVDLGARWEQYLTHGPAALEAEFLTRLRRWAPHGVRAAGRDPLAEGPLLEFSVRQGLTWGREGREVTRAAGLLPRIQPLPAPVS